MKKIRVMTHRWDNNVSKEINEDMAYITIVSAPEDIKAVLEMHMKILSRVIAMEELPGMIISNAYASVLAQFLRNYLDNTENDVVIDWQDELGKHQYANVVTLDKLKEWTTTVEYVEEKSVTYVVYTESKQDDIYRTGTVSNNTHEVVEMIVGQVQHFIMVGHEEIPLSTSLISDVAKWAMMYFDYHADGYGCKQSIHWGDVAKKANAGDILDGYMTHIEVGEVL